HRRQRLVLWAYIGRGTLDPSARAAGRLSPLPQAVLRRAADIVHYPVSRLLRESRTHAARQHGRPCMSTAPILEARGIHRRFGGVVAVKDVSLSVGVGEIVGLIGHNGSGKSTMVNLITGELETNGGSFLFGGQDVTALPPYKRAR